MNALVSPPVLALAIIAAIAAEIWTWALGWPETFDPLRSPWQFLALLVFAGLWFWISLSLAATALAHLRAEPEAMFVTWVPAPRAFDALVATAAVVAGVTLGLFALVIPGILLLIMWSQATMLILDGRAESFDALHASRVFTSGFRGEILLCGLTAAGVLLLVEFAGAGLAGLAHAIGIPNLLVAIARWAGRVLTTTFSISAAAAIYHEIDSRIEWTDADIK